MEAHSDITVFILFLLKRKREEGAFANRRTRCLSVHVGVPCVWNHTSIELILVLQCLQPTFPKVENTLFRSSPSHVTSNPCFPVHQLSSLSQPRGRSLSLSSSTPGRGRWERWLVYILTTESGGNLSYLLTLTGLVGDRLGLELRSSNSGVGHLASGLGVGKGSGFKAHLGYFPS